MSRVLITLALIIGAIYSCKNTTPDKHTETLDPTTIAPVTLSDLSLEDKGIPVNFQIDSKTTIKKGTQLIQWNVFLADTLPIEVSMWDTKAVFTVPEAVKEDIEIMSQEEGFTLIHQTPNGYIYKVVYEHIQDYGFYYVISKNDRLIEFSQTVEEQKYYNQEEIKHMFLACQKAY